MQENEGDAFGKRAEGVEKGIMRKNREPTAKEDTRAEQVARATTVGSPSFFSPSAATTHLCSFPLPSYFHHPLAHRRQGRDI